MNLFTIVGLRNKKNILLILEKEIRQPKSVALSLGVVQNVTKENNNKFYFYFYLLKFKPVMA
jgi:hypothetical protein